MGIRQHLGLCALSRLPSIRAVQDKTKNGRTGFQKMMHALGGGSKIMPRGMISTFVYEGLYDLAAHDTTQDAF